MRFGRALVGFFKIQDGAFFEFHYKKLIFLRYIKHLANCNFLEDIW